jgi:hypothetical protein
VQDLTGYDFLSVTKEGFVPVSIKSAFEARLGDIVFQCVRKIISSGYGISWDNIGLLRTISARP